MSQSEPMTLFFELQPVQVKGRKMQLQGQLRGRKGIVLTRGSLKTPVVIVATLCGEKWDEEIVHSEHWPATSSELVASVDMPSLSAAELVEKGSTFYLRFDAYERREKPHKLYRVASVCSNEFKVVCHSKYKKPTDRDASPERGSHSSASQ